MKRDGISLKGSFNIDQDGADVPTGLSSLDHILAGGYARNRSHLVEGQPGAGKTTLALQFLAAGAALGERCLYITLSESAAELRFVAETHGISLEGIDLLEVMPPEFTDVPSARHSVFYSADIELDEMIRSIMDGVRAASPERVVFDSLSEIRMLADSALRYRRQVLALKHFFALQNSTVLLLDDLSERSENLRLHSICHGVVRLEHAVSAFGAEQRRLRVFKMRARNFVGGYHDFVIRQGGLSVFPRLTATDNNHVEEDNSVVASGIKALDDLLGGGLDRGTSTLFLGSSGTGKSTLALPFVKAALDQGESALYLSFSETRGSFLRRSRGMGMDMRPHLEDGRLAFRQIDTAELTPGELSSIVCDHVADGVRIVTLDSLSGHQNAISQENVFLLQMHELLTHLSQQGVVTILILTQPGIFGDTPSPLEMTYLADTMVMLRFFEAESEIRRALSVIKKRTGFHERPIRELFFDGQGVHVGHKLTGIGGGLSGARFVDEGQSFLAERAPDASD